jgi:hypothetical protein
MEINSSLKTKFIVSAEVRRCETMSIVATVNHQGDKERGLLLIKHYVYNKGCKIYVQSRDINDNLNWCNPLSDGWVEEAKADQYIARQIKFDEDLWVLEVEDNKNNYTPL